MASAVRSIPAADRLFRPRIAGLREKLAGNLVPTAKKPISLARSPLARVLMQLDVEAALRAPAELGQMTMAGTVSGILAGYLSDRIGCKPIFLVTHSLMTPAALLLFYLPGDWVFLGAISAGFFTMATLPIGVVMAQALAPRGKSIVASLMMGFAFGLGGAVSPIVGKLADLFSIGQVLFGVALVPLPTLGLILLFPDVGRPKTFP